MNSLRLCVVLHLASSRINSKLKNTNEHKHQNRPFYVTFYSTVQCTRVLNNECDIINTARFVLRQKNSLFYVGFCSMGLGVHVHYSDYSF